MVPIIYIGVFSEFRHSSYHINNIILFQFVSFIFANKCYIYQTHSLLYTLAADSSRFCCIL